MKDLSALVWLTQLGLSVAVPLAAFLWLGIWLHRSLGWGQWTVWAGIALGLYCAVSGLVQSLKALDKLTKGKEKDKDPGPNYNEHH